MRISKKDKKQNNYNQSSIKGENSKKKKGQSLIKSK